MHLLKRTVLPGLMAFTITASGVFAQDWAVTLSESEVEALPEEASEPYQEAVEELDHANYEGAVKLLDEAAEQAPEHVELQFFTEVRARRLAEIYYSATSYSPVPDNMDYSSPPWRTSEVHYDIAEAALGRLQENPDLTTLQNERLQDETALVEEGRNNLAERDQQRFETASQLVSRIWLRRIEDLGLMELFIEQLDEEALRLAEQPEEEEGEDYTQLDPFSLLPGQHRENFLPPPPQPQQGQGQQQFGGSPGFPGAPGAAGQAPGFGQPPGQQGQQQQQQQQQEPQQQQAPNDPFGTTEPAPGSQG